jgi:hypothetical protein
MKVLLWAPTALFALLSLRALAFVAYQGLNGAALEEEIIVAGGRLGLRLDRLGHVQDPDRTMEKAVAARPRGARWGGWLLGLA